MEALELARACAALGEEKNACRAYTLALHELSGRAPEDEMEAAVYLLQFGGDYRIPYTAFCNLYARNCFRDDCLAIMTEAFYAPNEAALKKRYETNCKLLRKYPYIFRTDFPAFEELTLRFYPFDEKGYLPFDTKTEQFGPYINPKDPVVSRNFFKDLEKPILADDVYSQYELEYLVDNVRASERVARENHVYLHYTDWDRFCASLQYLDMRHVLKEKKAVFLMEEEIAQYPIDFKERFGIDYSTYHVQPVYIREINRLIWHTQLSSDNGGDFFNEVFDAHPNLLMMFSFMFDSIEEKLFPSIRSMLKLPNLETAIKRTPEWPAQVVHDLYTMKKPTEKDFLVAWFLSEANRDALDPASRIVPAIFFQPHFSNIHYSLRAIRDNRVMMEGMELAKIRKSPAFRFKYIKTFTPMRRFTTTYAAAVRTMYRKSMEQKQNDPDAERKLVVSNAVVERTSNRSFMRDPDDRLYRDSIVVRFEDGKLNPKATFSALAAFLDIPYTESMTYCSQDGVHDVQTDEGNVIGFDPDTVYRTYDEWTNDSERTYVEFLLRDAYAFYGYDFHYYDGAPMEEEKLQLLIRDFTTLNRLNRESWQGVMKIAIKEVASEMSESEEAEALEKGRNHALDLMMNTYDKARMENAQLLMNEPYFINEHRQPLKMIPLLKLDPALLEQPLYH